MARENQGLQIALIVFVMLTIILGVTTFLFFRQYEEATNRATASDAKATENMNGMRKSQEEANELKTMLGGAPTDTLTTLQETFATDMRTYAGTLPEENRSYRAVLEYMFKVLKDRETEVTDGKAQLETMKTQFVTREAEKDPQLQSAEKRATDAEGALKKAMADYEAERTRMKADGDKVAATLVSVRKEQDAAVAKLKSNLDQRNKQIQQLTADFSDTKKKLNEAVDPHLAVADGEVTWVNQRQGTVWINLGRADGLSRQASFAVYNAESTDLTAEAQKANIEVTQLLGDHLAEARVVSDTAVNPIMPGDKIQTPIWNPGEQKRFALAGTIDIDGDGHEDYDRVARIITMHGGVIDASMKPVPELQGKGKITANTTKLVLGNAPDETSPAEETQAFSQMIDAAKKLQVPTMSVNDLLQQMGWRAGSQTTGETAEGTPAFRPRRPPTRSAY